MPTTKIDIILDAAQAQVEAAKVEASLRGIEKAAKSTGENATESLTAMIGRKQQLAAVASQLESTLRGEARAMADLIQKSGGAANAQRLHGAQITSMNQTYDKLSAALANVKTQQAALNTEIRTATAEASKVTTEVAKATTQQAGLTAVTNAATPAHDRHAASVLKGGTMMDKFGDAMTRTTSRINVGRGALAGWDPLVESLARSFGGVTIAWAIAISVLSSLLTVLLRANKATEERLNVSAKSIDMEIALARATALNTDGAEGYRRVLGGITAQLIEYQKNLASLAEAERTQAANKDAITSAITKKEILGDTIEGYSVFMDTVDEAREKQGLAEAAVLKFREATHKSVEELIRFAANANISNERLREMAVNTGFSVEELAKLDNVLNTNILTLMRFNDELDKLKVPKMDVSVTPAGVQAQIEAVKKGMAEFSLGTQAASAAGIKSVKQLLQAYGPAFRQIGEDAKKAGIEITDPMIKQGIALQENEKKVRSRTGAIRSAALAENELVRKLKESQAALAPTSFEQKEQDIAIEAEAARNKLRINARYSKEKRATLEADIRMINQIEVNELELVRRQKVEKVKEYHQEAAALEAEGLTESLSRQLSAIQAQAAAKEAQIRRELGFTEEADIAIMEMHIAYANKAIRITMNMEQERRDKTIEDERQMWQTIEEERLKNDKKIIDTGIKELKRYEDAIGELTTRFKQFDPSGVITPDRAKIEKAKASLDTLGLSVDAVDRIFGTASKNVDQLQRRLDILGDTTPSVSAGMKEFFSSMVTSMEFASFAFNALGQAVSQFFEGLVTGEENAKGAFLNFLADILAFIGQAAIAAGTVFLFLPGHQGLGAGLIAAGIAAMALSGVLRGLAKNAQKSNAAGAGTGATSGAEAGRPAQPPLVIEFPTTPRAEPIVLTLDAQGTGKLVLAALESNGVVTVSSMRGRHSAQVSRTVKKMTGTEG